MLLTSRKIPDIEEALSPLTELENRVPLGGASVDPDILAYIDERIQNDRGLRRWKSSQGIQQEIRTALMEKADGMFRWTVCQLDALQNCSRLPVLRSALKNLPKSLDETYCRILCNIPEEHTDDVYKMLQWLTYSVRPLAIAELAEVVAVNVDGNPWFDCGERFPDPTEILSILSSLVTTEDLKTNFQTVKIIRLAHFSVQEYLVSDRILQQAAKDYSIQEVSANSSIAATCLAYLLQFDRPISEGVGLKKEEFPLAGYAALHWVQHLRPLGKDHMPTKLVLELMLTRNEVRLNWNKIYHRPSHLDRYFGFHEYGPDSLPVCFAAWAGLTELVRLLLEHGEDINSQSDDYGNALQATTRGYGDEHLVRLLLDRGADINAKSGSFGNALQAALSHARINEKIVRLLLEHGADVNASGGRYGSAIHAALFKGSESMVQLLLEWGADISIRAGIYDTTLQAACYGGKKSLVELLLEKGVDVNAIGGDYGTALQTAASYGGEGILKLLLRAGADINAQGGTYGTALQAAANDGNEQIIETLLKEGADVNTQGGIYGTVLQAAAVCGNEQIIETLLKEGADVNAQGGDWGTALQAAAVYENEQIIEILLKEGADVNARGGEFDTALQAAALRGAEQIVQLLLEVGADINAQGGRYGTALRAAAVRPCLAVVELLVKEGAEVTAQDLEEIQQCEMDNPEYYYEIMEFLQQAHEAQLRHGVLDSSYADKA
ncbi:MAG: hypothetical protein Q9181_007223 [Wetmoreana brouardii]